MKRRAIVISLCAMSVALIALSAALWFFMRPLVLFVEGDIPIEMQKSLRPSLSDHLRYRIAFLSEEELDDRAERSNASLIVFGPLTIKKGSYDALTALWGRDEYPDEHFDIHFALDEKEIYRAALNDKPKLKSAFVYRDSDLFSEDIGKALKTEREDLVLISYSDRITGANIDEIKEKLDENGIERVLLTDLENSVYLIRNTEDIKYFMDFRNASALIHSKVYSIEPMWSKAFDDALKGVGSDISFDYRVVTSH